MSSIDNQIAQYSLIVSPPWRSYFYDAMDWVHLTGDYEDILWNICILSVFVIQTVQPQMVPTTFGKIMAEYVRRIQNIVCS